MTSENNIREDGLTGSKKEEESMQQFLTFNIGGEEYGVGLMSVREIKGWSKTTRLPNSPDFMKGVINLRGVVIPIFDLRKRFGMGDTEPTEKNAVIILSVGKRLIGVLVDAVSDILSTNIEDIRTAPHVESKIDTNFVSGLISIEEKMVVLLDVERIFDPEMIDHADKVSAKSAE